MNVILDPIRRKRDNLAEDVIKEARWFMDEDDAREWVEQIISQSDYANSAYSRLVLEFERQNNMRETLVDALWATSKEVATLEREQYEALFHHEVPA